MRLDELLEQIAPEFSMALKLHYLLRKHRKLRYYKTVANFYGLGAFT